jgi:hypothetical protein
MTAGKGRGAASIKTSEAFVKASEVCVIRPHAITGLGWGRRGPQGTMDEVMQGDVSVMYVESTSGAQGARAAFDELEGHLPGMKGRKFYGIFDPAANAYRACVAMRP